MKLKNDSEDTVVIEINYNERYYLLPGEEKRYKGEVTGYFVLPYGSIYNAVVENYSIPFTVTDTKVLDNE